MGSRKLQKSLESQRVIILLKNIAKKPPQAPSFHMKPNCAAHLAGCSGLIFVFLSLIIVVLVPPLPSLAKTTAEVTAYYISHGHSFLIGNYVAAFAAVPSFIFFSHLICQIKKCDSDGWLWIAILITTVIAHSVGAVDLVFFQLAAHLGTHGLGHGQVVSPETLKIASDLACLGFGFFFIMQGALAVYIAWAILKTSALGLIHAWLGLATAGLSFLASLGSVQTTGLLTIGGPVTTAAFLISFIWITGISGAFLRVKTA